MPLILTTAQRAALVATRVPVASVARDATPSRTGCCPTRRRGRALSLRHSKVVSIACYYCCRSGMATVHSTLGIKDQPHPISNDLERR